MDAADVPLQPDLEPPTDAEDEAAAEARRRRGRWLVGGVAALLVVGALVGQQVLDARREARATRFDHVPGVLLPLTETPVLREDVSFATLWDPVQVGDLLVVPREADAEDTVRIEAVTRATGDLVWRRDVTLPPYLAERVRQDTDPASVTCRPLGDATVACVATTASTYVGEAVQDLLVVLDATDGTVVDERPHTADDWATLGDAILTVDAAPTDEAADGPTTNDTDVDVDVDADADADADAHIDVDADIHAEPVGDEAADDGTSDNGTSDDGTSDDGTSEDGTSEDGTSEDGTDDGATEAVTDAVDGSGDRADGAASPAPGSDAVPGRLTVEARTATGTVLWSWSTEDGVVLRADTDTPFRVSVVGDHLLVSTMDHWWLLDGRGEPLRDRAMEEPGWTLLGRAGAVGVASYTASAYGAADLVLDGGTVEAGYPLPPMVDDGSAPEVTLALRHAEGVDHITAWDVTTGDELWSRATSVGDPIVLDGRTYVLHDGRVAAVDVRSGDERWDAPAGDRPSQLATDGRHILVLGSGGGVRALEIDTGELVWEGEVDGAAFGLWPQSGVVMAPQNELLNPRLLVPRA